MKTRKPFITLSHDEIETLSSTRSAVAMSVYMAIKSFMFGRKVSAYPTRKTLLKRIGNDFSLRAITTAISKLVKVGLIERMYNDESNLWWFKLVRKDSSKGSYKDKKQPTRGGGNKNPPCSSSKPDVKENIKQDKRNNISKEKALRWFQKVVETVRTVEWLRTSEMASEWRRKGEKLPTYRLPEKIPYDVSLDVIEAEIEDNREYDDVKDFWMKLRTKSESGKLQPYCKRVSDTL